MNMNYQIREMENADAEGVLAIFQQGIDGQNATFDQEVPTWEKWNESHFSHSRFVITNENDEIVGWCALKPISDRNCFRGVAEVSIYLDQNYQSKGLGKILIRKLILDSEEHDFWTLQAGIFPENKASVSLFQSSGFRIVGTRERISKMNGKWRDVLLLEKRSREVGV